MAKGASKLPGDLPKVLRYGKNLVASLVLALICAASGPDLVLRLSCCLRASPAFLYTVYALLSVQGLVLECGQSVKG